MLWPSVRLSRPADDQRGRLAAGESNIVGGAALPTRVAHSPTTMSIGRPQARSPREGAKMGSNTS
jgi:hypothetical protein